MLTKIKHSVSIRAVELLYTYRIAEILFLFSDPRAFLTDKLRFFDDFDYLFKVIREFIFFEFA